MARTGTILSIVLLLSGCGRPATLQECEEIAGRVAELTYMAESKTKTPANPEQIQTIRARVRDSMMKECVGKRITQRALQCVRTAKSADAIKKDCFD